MVLKKLSNGNPAENAIQLLFMCICICNCYTSQSVAAATAGYPAFNRAYNLPFGGIEYSDNSGPITWRKAGPGGGGGGGGGGSW